MTRLNAQAPSGLGLGRRALQRPLAISPLGLPTGDQIYHRPDAKENGIPGCGGGELRGCLEDGYAGFDDSGEEFLFGSLRFCAHICFDR